MEVMPFVAGECRHFVTLLKRFHADDALTLGLKQVWVVCALIQLELLHRSHHAVIFAQRLLHVGASGDIDEALSLELLVSLAAARRVAPDPANGPDDDNDADDKADHRPVHEVAVKSYHSR